MRNAKNNTIRIAGRKTNVAAITAEWLTAKMRNGRRRIETLSWRKLAAIHHYTNDNKVWAAINREARRCGYTPATILALHLED
jgi:hypothetical protein